MLGKLLDTAAYIKAKIKKDDLEIALADATTDDNWQASTATLHQIASSAYDNEKWKRISDFLWDKLKKSKNWKKILKCMNIVEFLLKNGPGFACTQLKYQIMFFKTMESFQQFQGSSDRGAPIRERAKAITNLLQNDEMLEDERLRAHQIRQKMSHLTGTTSYSSEVESKPKSSSQIPKYQSYSSQTYQTTKEQQGFYNYGHGNYGDRYEDKKYDHDYFQSANRFKREQEAAKAADYVPAYQAPPPEPKVQTPIKTPQPEAPKVTKPVGDSPTRPKFSTITQQLLKNTQKHQQSHLTEQPREIIKPDLSYKASMNEEQLIDFSEQQFVQSRYHFETPSQNIARNEVTKQADSLTSTANSAKNQATTPSVPGNVEPQPNFVQQSTNKLDPFDFLGISTVPETKSKEQAVTNISPPSSTQQQIINHQIHAPQPTQLYVQPPVIQHPPQHQPSSPLKANISYTAVINQPPHQPFQQYSPGFPQNVPYQQYSSPYPDQMSQPPFYGNSMGYPPAYNYPYGQPPVHNYSQPYNHPHVHISYNQPSIPNPMSQHLPAYNPYANIPQNFGPSLYSEPSLNAGNSTWKSEPQSSQANQSTASSKKQESRKAEKSNGFNLKDLTDLSDIALDISQNKNMKAAPRKVSPVKEQNNNIKIDPWAW